MIEIPRTIPFELYSYSFENSESDKLVYRTAKLAKEVFKNLAYLIANIVIKTANLLRLYRLTKTEVKNENKLSFYTESQERAASCIILAKTFNRILGPGKISSTFNWLGNMFQLSDSAPNFNNMNISIAYLVASLLFSENYYFNAANLTWRTFSTFRNTYQGLTACKNYAYRNPIDAAKGTLYHLIITANALRTFSQFNFNQTTSNNKETNT